MKYPRITIFVLATEISTGALAMGDHDDDEPFAEARLSFELNDTDGDLGIHGNTGAEVRIAAINALGEIGDDDAIPYLLQARYDSHSKIRANADAILQEIGVVEID